MFVNLLSFFVFLSILLLVISVLIISVLNCKKLIKKYNDQNIKAINLYLDKKLISKLLDKLSNLTNESDIDYLIDDIFNYFGINFLVLKNVNKKKIFRFGEVNSDVLTDSECVDLLCGVSKIKSDSGYLMAKQESENQYLIFKNQDLSMMIVTHESHHFTESELETITNEIMLVLRSFLKVHATSL
jgi:hypothetical protein